MTSKRLVLISGSIAGVLSIFLLYHRTFPTWFSTTLLIVVITLHSMFYRRFHVMDKTVRQINKTIENFMSGNYLTDTIPFIEHQHRILNANISRLARHMERMTLKTHEDEQMIDLITSNITSPIIYIDIDGRTRYLNEQFKVKFKTKLRTNEMYEFILNKVLYQFIDEAFIHEKDMRATLEINKNFFYANSIRINDGEGSFVGVLCIFHDITELKRFERLQREFLADASHELKTPISAIKGATEILLDRPNEPEVQRDFLEMINTENERMEQIVQDILLMSRLESETSLNLQEIDLKDIFDEIIQTVSLRLQEKQQLLDIHLEDSLIIHGDFQRIRQAFLNLIINAINYSEPGQTISIAGVKDERRVRVTIKDHGIGISKKDLPHIFERFYRVDKGRSRVTGGTGLGLSIVKSVLDIHRAKIEVNSKVNKGTEFIITFEERKEPSNYEVLPVE